MSLSVLRTRVLPILALSILAIGCSSIPGELGFGGGADQAECDAMRAMLLDPDHANSDDRFTDLASSLDQTLGDADNRYLEMFENGPDADPDDPLAEVRQTTDVLNTMNQRSFEGCGAPVIAAASHVSITNQLCSSSFDCDEPPHMASEIPCFTAAATVIDLGGLSEDGFAVANYQPIDCETKEPVEVQVDGSWAPIMTLEAAMDPNVRQVYEASTTIPAGTSAEDAWRNGWFRPAYVSTESTDSTSISVHHQTTGLLTNKDLAPGHVITTMDFRLP